MFAIFGVSLFGGKFQYCKGDEIDRYQVANEEEVCENINNSVFQCQIEGGEWSTYDHNFDNVINAMLTLFIVSSLEGWPDIMYQATDGTGVEEGPTINATPMASYYFVSFILVGSFFFLNLFIGVIFFYFDDCSKQEKKKGGVLGESLTENQLKWTDMQKMIVKATPDYETTNVPHSSFRRFFHDIVRTSKFDIVIMVFIVLNMLQMAIIYNDASQIYLDALKISNYVFTSIFIIECILKLLAYGKSYFYNNWNLFDFFVVCSSIIDIILGILNQSAGSFLTVGPQLARVLRVLRVSR